MGATKDPHLADALYRVKRGLAGYVSYLAACDMNQAFSEYVLYEPILRILTARGYTVECEYRCPGIAQPAQGDKKRVDFRATAERSEIGLEVKWIKSEKPKIQRDIAKLSAFKAVRQSSIQLLCVFGRKVHLERVKLEGFGLKERGKGRYADLGKTKYGCRIFELRARP